MVSTNSIGILYHLNAMEEPYQDDYPKVNNFHEKFGPRNIVDTVATDKDDSTTDPRWGRVGKQTIKDGGPLPPSLGKDPKAKFDMTNVDEALVRRSKDFMERSVKAGKPFLSLAQLYAHACVDALVGQVEGVRLA